MANATIDFEEIYSGQKGSEVSQIILENLKKLSARIVELEDQISQIKGSSIDGSTVIDNTGSISVQYAPTTVFGKTYPISQVSYVSVKVTYGTTDLYPGTDDSGSHYSYSITNSDIMSSGKKIGTVESVVESSNLKFKVTILPNTISDSNFSFTITFKGKTYRYTVPILIMNDNHALNGQSVYMSTVFKRSTVGAPSTPTGGSFDNPIPTGWSDGIPGGNGDLYTSHRRFTSDGQPPQSANWSTPTLAQDSSDIDICYSAYTTGRPKTPSELGLPHGSQDSDTSIYRWHDSGTENDVWMAISVKSGKEWGDWSVLKIKGENGTNGDWKNAIYKEFDGTSLEAPNIMNPNNFVGLKDEDIRKDDGSKNTEERNKKWKDGPSPDGIWWMSVGTIDGTTNLCQYGWSTPVKVTPGEGVPGAACFMSTVFKRGKAGDISTPTGGSYSSPVPGGWSDGIPADDSEHNPIWESHRRFTSDGKTPQDAAWSTPKLMIDTADFDCCYSDYNNGLPPEPKNHGSQEDGYWHNEGKATDIWMATSYKRSQGEWSNWTITKIVGENGRNGDWMDYVFKQYSGDTLSAPTTDDPTSFDNFTDQNDVNFGWKDVPGTGPDWWMSCALIDGTTGNVAMGGKGWSEPKRLQGDKGVDGSYTEYQYKVSDNMLNHPKEGDPWYFNVLDAYHEISDCDYLLPNFYMWMRQRRYDGTTKLWGVYEYMRVTGEQGEPGTSIELKGTLNSYKELFEKDNVSDGYSYILFGHIWNYNTSTTYRYYNELTDDLKQLYNPDNKDNFPNPGYWLDCGQFVGPSGTSQYLHIKYAKMLDKSGTTTDGKVYFYPSSQYVSNEPDRYIGVLVDSNPEAQDSDYSLYTWSQFTGDDGYGYEYIYRLKADSKPWEVPTPSGGTCAEYSSEEYQRNDYVPDGWTDNPSGITSKMPYEFMCRRVKVNKIWQHFTGQSKSSSLASLYSYYGKDAPYIQRQWAKFQSLVLTDDMKDDTHWSDSIPKVESGYYLWERSRTVTPPRGNEPEKYGNWQYERRTGERGNTGTGLEIQGSMSSYEELFALSDPTKWVETHTGTYHDPKDGTCYIVFGHLWSWVASSTEIIYENLPDKEAYYAKYGTTLSQRHWRDGGQVQGPQGQPGSDGTSAYLHIKFANTAKYVSGNTYIVEDKTWLTTFKDTNDGEAPGRFIGMYTDSNQTDADGTDDKYIWTKYTGDDGVDYEYIYTRTLTDAKDVNVPFVTNGMIDGTDTTKFNVVASYDPVSGLSATSKAYQENDWVPYDGTIVNEKNVTDYIWTDNPMGPTEEWPFEWCCKREKTNGLWGAFYGKASDTSVAFLYNKYGDSALQLDMTNQLHGYKRNASGTCIVETVVCKINASKDGEPREIKEIVVSGDTSQFQSITPVASGGTVTLTNSPNMTSGGTLTFHITVGNKTYDNETYEKTFNYSVTDDGTPGLTIYFDPESIVAEENILSGGVSTANTYAHLNVYQDGKPLKYNSGSSSSLTANEYSVSILNLKVICHMIGFTTSGDNGRYKFQINNFDVDGKKPYGGTVEFEITTGGIKYKRTLKWMVNWLGYFRQIICGDTMTNISSSVKKTINEKGLLTIESAQTVFIASASGITANVKQLSGDVNSLTETTASLQLSASGFSNYITSANTKFSSIEQRVDEISLKVGQLHGGPNLIPNSRLNLMSNYYWFDTKELILNKGNYTLSAKCMVGASGNCINVTAYLFDNNWNNTIKFAENVWEVKDKTFTVTNDNTRCSIGIYFLNPQTQFNAPIGSYGYTEWIKLEAGSGATAWCESSSDGATNNILKVIPYDVADINSGVTGTRTKITNPNGNYVRIENNTGNGWQLRYKFPNHYVESYVNDGSPKTLYYWLVAKSMNNGSGDTIVFGSENRTYDFATYHYNPIHAVNSRDCPSISLPGGWVMYYKTLNMFNSAFRQKNLLEVYASYKISVLSVPTSEITLTLKIGEKKQTYDIAKNATILEIVNTINKTPVSGFTSTVEGSNIYITSTDNMQHVKCGSDHPNIVSIMQYKNAWTKVSNGVVAQNGQLKYETSKSPEDKANQFTLGEQIIAGGLKASTWYTLSFVAKNTATQSPTSPILSFVYFYGASEDNPLGDFGGSKKTKVYVDIATATSASTDTKNVREMSNPTPDCNYSWYFTSDFREYSYSFMTSSKYDTTKEARVLFRIDKTAGKPYGVTIKNIKLEQSAGKTGYYNIPGHMSENPEQYIGINGVIGTWDVLACGISTEGIPSPASINPSLKIASLLDTGIDIENKKVTITADNFIVRNNSGETSFLIDESGKVNLNVLNAEAILTNGLSAQTINANSATLTNINISGESSFAGLLKKTKTILTADNLRKYAYLNPGGFWQWELEKIGTWLEIQSLPEGVDLYCWFPSIYADVD